MALPNDKISVSLVASTLVVSETDVGRLCTHSAINMWSRWKPVSYPSVQGLTIGQFGASYASSEANMSGDFGIRIPESSSTTNVNNIRFVLIDAVANYWTYRRPRGGDFNEPFRLADFRNYEHEAVPFILCATPPSNKIEIGASTGRLSIYFDLDPADSFYNLQSSDFLNNGTLDLRNYTFYGIITEYEGGALVASAETETILDQSGELNSPVLVFNNLGSLPQMNTGFEYEIYIALRNKEYTAGWEFISLPVRSFGDTRNKFPIKFNVIQSPIDEGGGVEDFGKDVSVSYAFGGVYKLAEDVVEELGGTSILHNTTGELIMRVKIKNGSNSNKVFQRNSFYASNYYNMRGAYPDYIYDSNPSGAGSSGTIITINANSSKEIWLYFSDILFNTTNPEIAIFRDDIEIINGVFGYTPGTNGWT